MGIIEGFKCIWVVCTGFSPFYFDITKTASWRQKEHTEQISDKAIEKIKAGSGFKTLSQALKIYGCHSKSDNYMETVPADSGWAVGIFISG